jgi:hypothetical protein
LAVDSPIPSGGPRHPAKKQETAYDESLRLLASLQVKVDVLRRAQAIAPQSADELQSTIDEIECEIRALDSKGQWHNGG